MLNDEGMPVPTPATDERQSRLQLPPVPQSLAAAPVAAWSEPIVIDSYLPVDPDNYPAFLDTRVYQGSSGKVYPMPFHERIEQSKVPHEWQAVHLENEWVRLVILPELGGRIHVAYDKVAGYDFFYRNNVIKPALVGLAGPWISGGVEFNWPQHHRPGTFLPTDWHIEHEADGAVTVWCSDHDPLLRMKGMHGIRLRPDSNLVEARVRLYNRTDETHTFLWWANVAAAVNDDYQSFFPRDVHHVADHAKRAVATFPQVDGRYYGIDYPGRVDAEHPDADRLDWYRNIPVPTSYMVMSTRDDFFGGYDHGREAGFVHWADRSFAPGKKQWTWGNSEFGWAWDANLTDGDGPYVELMAGVYTDNQPDFSWIAPGETKTFSQYWYPINVIGPAQQATREGAVALTVLSPTSVRIGVAPTSVVPGAGIHVLSDGVEVWSREVDLAPGRAIVETVDVPGTAGLTVEVRAGGRVLLTWAEADAETFEPTVATEPADPADIASADELYLTGQYLAQYRHATRQPEPYWLEALRRDPGDVRCNTALAERLAAAGLDDEAERHLRTALARLLARVPNPADGAAHYLLGLVLARTGRHDEAEDALRKALWNSAQRTPAGYALARSLARRGDLPAAEAALREVLAIDTRHSQATVLLALVLEAQGRADDGILWAHLAVDPLDQWARHAAGEPVTTDAPTLLDVALDYAGAGFTDRALGVLDDAALAARTTALGQVQVGPLVHYHRALLLDGAGQRAEADAARAAARTVDARHCLPSRLDDVRALRAALEVDPQDARAALLLGSWFYDKRRHDDAIAAWELALAGESDTVEAAVIAHRNLGIALFNVRHDRAAALAHFEAARALAPDDAKLFYEYDQLLARTGATAVERLALHERHADLVRQRDDLCAEFATLLIAAGRAEQARAVLLGRRFQPWEGGEGQILAAWDGAMKSLAASAPDARAAVAHLQAALTPPASIGEARHPLANAADIFRLLGDAHAAAGDAAAARLAWETAAGFTGDFVNMSEQPYSVQTIHSISALQSLGRTAEADALASGLAAYIERLRTEPAKVDYFATSLPTMLLFHDDPQNARLELVETLRTQLAELHRTTAPAVTGHQR